MSAHEAFRLIEKKAQKQVAEQLRATANRLEEGASSETTQEIRHSEVLFDRLKRLQELHHNVLETLNTLGGDLPLAERDNMLKAEVSRTSEQVPINIDIKPQVQAPQKEPASPKTVTTQSADNKPAKNNNRVETYGKMQNLSLREGKLVEAAFALNGERTDYQYPSSLDVRIAAYDDLTTQKRIANAKNNGPTVSTNLIRKLTAQINAPEEKRTADVTSLLHKLENQPEYRGLTMEELTKIIKRELSYHDLLNLNNNVPHREVENEVDKEAEGHPYQLLDREIYASAEILLSSDIAFLKEIGITHFQPETDIISLQEIKKAREKYTGTLTQTDRERLRKKFHHIVDKSDEVFEDQLQNRDALDLVSMVAEIHENDQIDRLFEQPHVSNLFKKEKKS